MIKIYDTEYNKLFEDFYDSVEPEVNVVSDEDIEHTSSYDYVISVDIVPYAFYSAYWKYIRKLNYMLSYMSFTNLSDISVYACSFQKNGDIKYTDILNDLKKNRMKDENLSQKDIDVITIQFSVSGKIKESEFEAFMNYLVLPRYNFAYSLLIYSGNDSEDNRFIDPNDESYIAFIDMMVDYNNYLSGKRKATDSFYESLYKFKTALIR